MRYLEKYVWPESAGAERAKDWEECETVARCLSARCGLFRETAKYVAHHADEPQRAGVTDAVKHAVGILARTQNALVAEDGEMLGNIALRSTDAVNDVLHADFAVAEDAQNFEA